MALTNKGFNGTVTEADFAFMGRIGMAEGVESSAAWAVTQGTGRQTSTAAQSGWAFSAGVVSKDTAAILTSLGTPTNGQWYLIVRRINWATDTVSVVAIPHTTTSTTVPTAAPAGLPTMSTTPGTEWDQKLAWAWVRSSDTTMFLVDLRNQPLETRLTDIAGLVAGSGRGTSADYIVTTPASLDAVTNASVGDTAWMTTPGTNIAPFRWAAWGGSGGTIDWRPAEPIPAVALADLTTFTSTLAGISDLALAAGARATISGSQTYLYTGSAWVLSFEDTGWVNISSFGANWSGSAPAGYRAMAVRRINNVVHLRGSATKNTSWAAFETMFTVPVGYRPTDTVTGYARFTLTSSFFDVSSTGVARIATASPGTDSVLINDQWVIG